MDHSRFDEDHRKTCDDCRDAYEDFCQEQEAEAQLDAMIEQDTIGA